MKDHVVSNGFLNIFCLPLFRFFLDEPKGDVQDSTPRSTDILLCPFFFQEQLMVFLFL